MWHVHYVNDFNGWVVRKQDSKFYIFCGSKWRAVWKAICISKFSEVICVHNKRGIIRKIL